MLYLSNNNIKTDVMSKIKQQEKFIKGVLLDRDELLKIIHDNSKDLKIELQTKNKYVDGTESIVIELKVK